MTAMATDETKPLLSTNMGGEEALPSAPPPLDEPPPYEEPTIPSRALFREIPSLSLL